MRLSGLLASLAILGLVPQLAAAGLPTQQVLKVTPKEGWYLTGQQSKPVYKQMPYAYTVKVPYTETKEVNVDGVVKKQEVTAYRTETKTAIRRVCMYVTETTCMPVDPEKAKAFETDGKRISAADVAKRCKSDTLVMVSSDTEMIPDYYATMLKPGTIILALPPAPIMPPMLPLPGPVPQQIPQPPPASQPDSNATASTSPAGTIRLVSLQPPAEAGKPAANFMSPIPSLLAPQLVFLSHSGAEGIKIRQFDERLQEGEINVLDNDSSVATETMTKVKQIVRHSTTTTLPWNSVRVSHPSEADLPANRVQEKLGKETTGLLSVDGKPIDPFWLKNFKSTVLVVRGVAIQPPLPGYYSPMMMPGPMVAPPASPVGPVPAPAAPVPVKPAQGV